METKPFNDHSFAAFLKQKALMGSCCGSCGALYCPPRAFCPACHSTNMSWYQLQGNGRLKAFTSIFVCSPQMVAQGYGRDNPYCVGVVQLDEGPRVDARIVGVDAMQPESIRVGTPMMIEHKESKAGEGAVVLAFRPA
ncbi:MAG: Zn-ribbon domain-containing OB-fold protein [Deltaproteobacteria bacterium]|nr:Zn-ribbon domain-containing OB-fold protein [Candidatus Anaeroferrophillus wilburensis]MBN2887810.1 Zn-ribbon domain-containing OB-fold protein [Deltaproteobacteria bacterium]